MRNLPLLIIYFFLFLLNTRITFAVENPLALTNNKMGVHILFASEINSAAKLVNSNGGDWGYVTIPIQSGDKDVIKWQKFMDDARRLHVIPIIRLATEGDYFNTSVWRKPTAEDVLDFANFLDSLEWPLKNKYIVVFNEVNRGDEWGGSPNPEEYAGILSFAVKAFKSLSDDFFIISAGLDNAAADDLNKSMNEYNFMLQMNYAVPGIFSQIDGLGSHSYPNPAFTTPPWVVTDKSVSSFKFEKKLAFELSGKNLPVFITETGWSSKNVNNGQIPSYFSYAFKYIWSDNDVAAVTPFLLEAGRGPFFEFSLLGEDGNYNEISNTLAKILKINGKPTINGVRKPLFAQENDEIPVKTFPNNAQYDDLSIEKARVVTPFFKWLLGLDSP